MSPDRSPRTEAGRRLLDALALPWKPGSVGYEGMVAEGYRPAILAIEQEAADLAVAERLAELRAAVEGLAPATGMSHGPLPGGALVTKAAVLALLRGLQESR